jgi:xylulokinase
MRRVFLGIDCGTQSTKALLLDGDTGETVAVGRADHDLVSRTDGTREQEPAWWLAAASAAVREALALVPGLEVSGIGVSGQQHGLVALDAHDAPVRPAKLWNDTSTAADCRALTERMGGEAAVHAATGNVFLSGYTAPKVEWLRRVEPAAYRASARFCLPHDYLNLWLTGEFATEAGDASGTAYVDVRARAYAPAVLAAIDPDRDWAAALPPIRPPDVPIGTLRPAVAAELGLPAGIPVSIGGGDNMCAAIGVGAVRPGPAVMSLGTSGTVFGYAATPAIDPLREVSAFCDSTGGWLPLACVLNCTLPLEWVRGLFALDRARFDALVATVPVGADGLRFLPWLDGERTPNVPAAAAELTGLRTGHGPAHLARAVVEGVTAGLAHALRAFERTGVSAGTILLVGGGARSDPWAQLIADWLRLPIERPAAAEAVARGAAIQVAHLVDGAPLDRPAPVETRWEPRPTEDLAQVAAAYAALVNERAAQG